MNHTIKGFDMMTITSNGTLIGRRQARVINIVNYKIFHDRKLLF